MSDFQMKVVQMPSGKWVVIDERERVGWEFETNEQAWAAYDRLANEPMNRREAVANWLFKKDLGNLFWMPPD